MAASFVVGSRVTVHSLAAEKFLEHNGKEGIITSNLDSEGERYGVRFSTGELMNLKPSNFTVLKEDTSQDASHETIMTLLLGLVGPTAATKIGIAEALVSINELKALATFLPGTSTIKSDRNKINIAFKPVKNTAKTGVNFICTAMLSLRKDTTFIESACELLHTLAQYTVKDMEALAAYQTSMSGMH